MKGRASTFLIALLRPDASGLRRAKHFRMTKAAFSVALCVHSSVSSALKTVARFPITCKPPITHIRITDSGSPQTLRINKSIQILLVVFANWNVNVVDTDLSFTNGNDLVDCNYIRLMNPYKSVGRKLFLD